MHSTRKPQEIEPRSPSRPLAGLLVIGLGASLPPLDFAVNVAFPAITAAFSLDTQAIRWVVVWYVLSYASLMLAFGKLGDLIGYRRVFRAGLLLSTVAFALCALAPDFGWLLAARVTQGIAAALVMSCAPALATSLFDESRRIRVLGAFAGMGAAASVLGPLLGGASIAVLDWAGVFWFRVPIALLALLLLPLLPQLPRPVRPERRSFDPGSSLLLAAGLAMVLLAPALLQSGASAWPALGSAAAGAALLGAFAHRQRSVAEPILPLAAIRAADFALTNLFSIALHLTAFSVPLLVPYYLARIAGAGPLGSGVLLTASPVGMMIGSALAAPAARALGRWPAALLGAALMAMGQFAIGLWPASPALVPMLASLLLHGAGIGLFQVAYTDIVVAALPLSDRGVAGSLAMMTRTVGIVLGAAALTAALGAVESGRLAAGEPAHAAFLAAFQSVFLHSAFVFVAFIALACLLRRAWSV